MVAQHLPIDALFVLTNVSKGCRQVIDDLPVWSAIARNSKLKGNITRSSLQSYHSHICNLCKIVFPPGKKKKRFLKNIPQSF
jgi:hypothetical protein